MYQWKKKPNEFCLVIFGCPQFFDISSIIRTVKAVRDQIPPLEPLDFVVRYERLDDVYRSQYNTADASLCRLCDNTFPDVIIFGNALVDSGPAEKHDKDKPTAEDGEKALLIRADILPYGLRRKVLVIDDELKSSLRDQLEKWGYKHFITTDALCAYLKESPMLLTNLERDEEIQLRTLWNVEAVMREVVAAQMLSERLK
jgi:hypothetical protein